ncbi:hypothetical protein [Mycobacterium riyadhense]|uniref:hypothetical protein n=1 Tax=Mycobacterium riyadhense TaxID=486698 RepID=UPI00195CBE5A|nr:hypothetical protein [Mycobacterium riyadhense]
MRLEQRSDFSGELTVGTQSRTLIGVADESNNLQDLLVAALHNSRPPIIEPAPPITFSASPTDQLLQLLVLAANQGAESDNAEMLTGWEGRDRKLAAAINEVIERDEPADE